MYTEFYGLTNKPFQLTPDLRYLYPSAGHKRAMAYLRYGLEQGEGFVVITGHIGTGKTLLIQHLLSEVADRNMATARIATANLEANRVPAVVASALGQPFEGKSKEAVLANLERALKRARQNVNGVLLIVDEAQTLSPNVLEELRILSNLETDGQALVQIFLVGQTELRKNLRGRPMEQFRQRVVASFHLEPLNAEECKRYIGFRLLAAGWTGNPSFSNEVYDHVYANSGGIPRKINILMDRILVFGFLEEIQDFTEDHVTDVMEEMKLELAGDLANDPDGEPEPAYEPPGVTNARGSGPELESRLRALESKLEKLSTHPAGSRGPTG